MRESYFGELKSVNSPQEMRAELFRLSYDNSIVRNILDKANYLGLSGEDKYTELAYYAMKVLIEYQNKHIDFLAFNTKPSPIIVKDAKP